MHKLISLITCISALIIFTLTGCELNTTAPASVTLSFNCTVYDDDTYSLLITNNNAEPVTINQVDIGFYNNSGMQMGEDTPDNIIVSADTSYNYQGTYAQFELGGIPYACREIQWQLGE